jgi:hypothetical protein
MRDIRELLELAKADAPASRLGVEQIVAAGRRRLRRRRIALGGAGAATALAVGVVAAVALLDPAPGPVNQPPAAPESVAAAPSPPFSFTFAGYTVGDYRVGPPAQATPAYASAPIYQDHIDVGKPPELSRPVGSLTVYQPGVFRTDVFAMGQPLTVRGRTAYTTTLTHRDPSAAPYTSMALAFQYNDNAWAVIDSNEVALPLTVERALAEELRTTGARPARAPYALGYVPSGYKLASAGPRGLDDGDEAVSRAVLAPDATSFDQLTQPYTFDAGPDAGVQIVIAPDQAKNPRHASPGACAAPKAYCDVPIDGTKYYVEVYDSAAHLPPSELLRIAQGLDFTATVDQPDTWPPIGE